jgi:peptidoglycan/LPS O-acetylase OafA/YrhL
VLAGAVWLVANPGPVTAKLLSAPPALFFGRASFYLCHWPILKVIQAWQPSASRLVGLGCSALPVAVSIALTCGLCVSVEEPLRRFGRRGHPAAASLSRKPEHREADHYAEAAGNGQ